jgi:hypothetical protein
MCKKLNYHKKSIDITKKIDTLVFNLNSNAYRQKLKYKLHKSRSHFQYFEDMKLNSIKF